MEIKSWCKDLEESAQEQAQNLSELPFAYHHIALMADAHFGFGMPIGGVLATTDCIVPNAVGVDIGCGVISHKTNLRVGDLDSKDIKNWMSNVRKKIPTGFLSHKEEQHLPEYFIFGSSTEIEGLSIKKIVKKASHQVGTLGGGNHFIELQKDQDGFIWIMIHSGSRNVGYTIANHFNKVAIELNKRWYSNTKDDLAFLPIGLDATDDYISSMRYCMEFAKYNRLSMMKVCVELLIDKPFLPEDSLFAYLDGLYDVPHNYVALENHFGQNVWVHRKGATRARIGDLCIIPGSQGSHSYIGKGLGNPDSFMSCSHGAGRKMSRSKARKELDFESEKKRLDDMGVIHALRSDRDLDESPSAYKDIQDVMDAQKDLVLVTSELTPLAVIKGN